MQDLRLAIERLEAEGAAFLDLKELASLVDRLQGLLCQALYEGKKRGDNLIEGKTPCGWVKATCRLSAAGEDRRQDDLQERTREDRQAQQGLPAAVEPPGGERSRRHEMELELLTYRFVNAADRKDSRQQWQ